MSFHLRTECDACGRMTPIGNGKHECRECGAVCVNTAEFAEWLRHNTNPVPESWKYPDLGTIKMGETPIPSGCTMVIVAAALALGTFLLILWALGK